MRLLSQRDLHDRVYDFAVIAAANSHRHCKSALSQFMQMRFSREHHTGGRESCRDGLGLRGIHGSPASSLPEFIVENPKLGDWFALALPGKLTLKTGKVEIGQNILTALRQIAAEELELPFSVVDVLSGDTSVSPDEGPTVASLSIMMSGPAVRVAAAEMRGRLFQAAAARLGVPASRFSAVDESFHIAGTVTEAEVTYWTVMATSISTKELQEVFPVRIQKPIGLSARALFLLISSKKLSGPAFIP